MASSLQRVLQNFAWRIESKTPTEQTLSIESFSEISPNKVQPGTAAPRTFAVTWEGAGDVVDLSDFSGRTQNHTFQIEVYYPAGVSGMGWTDVQRLIVQDRHDIIATLRDSSNWVGWDSSNSSTDIGLYSRKIEEDELDRSEEEVWTLRQTWICVVREAE